MTQDYYEVLGVSRTADDDEIKKRFRKLAKEHHPDKGGDPERFRKIKEAYDTLGDPKKRAEYDNPSSGKIFEDLFTSYTRGHRWEHMPPGWNPAWDSRTTGFKARNPFERLNLNIQYELPITFEEMCRGCKKTFSVMRRIICPECKGKGGEDFSACSFCAGKGKMNSFLHESCGVCRGRGEIPAKSCIRCAGQGLASKDQVINMTIRPGVNGDTVADLKGLGHETVDGDVGDVQVGLHVKPHKFFQRQGLDIHCTLRIDAIRAIVGGDVVVQTIHGESLITIPPGTQNGHEAILNEEGIHTARRKGNHIIEIKLVVPTLKPEDRATLERLSTQEPELEPLKEKFAWR